MQICICMFLQNNSPGRVVNSRYELGFSSTTHVYCIYASVVIWLHCPQWDVMVSVWPGKTGVSSDGVFILLLFGFRLASVKPRHYSVIIPAGSFLPQASCWPLGIAVACLSVCVCVSVQTKTNKLGQKMQNTLVIIPNILGLDWPWPSSHI